MSATVCNRRFVVLWSELSRGILLLFLFFHTLAAFAQTSASTSHPVSAPSRVIEIAGIVEYQFRGHTNWPPATNGLALHPGDRLRTRTASRAAVQFSDRSVLRLGESTTLEIQPPRRAEKRRFSLPIGSLFFFNRERPAEVEFETPLVSGAIRGTEFVLNAGSDGATRLALLDGAVELATADATLELASGEQAHVEPGRAPVKSPLIEIASLVQWALYYPAVVNPDDLAFTPEDRAALSPALDAYRSGDLLAAHAAISDVPFGGEAREMFRAVLDLAVGQVVLAESRLGTAPADAPVTRALREIIELVRSGNSTAPTQASPQTASEWLARSFTLQARFDLIAARQAARQAVALAPEFGLARVRLAELETSQAGHEAALVELDHALKLAPRHAPAHALRGFTLLERGDARAALAAFDQALALDAALGNAWLGRGLAQLRLRQRDAALQSFQAAAALEPRRALARSYLGKAFSETGESKLAEKDFRLAKELDPGDPTAWLYSALHQWQENRPNAAVRELERSVELNDNRRVFRSRLLLDRDRAVRSANLAAIYREAGLPEVSVQSAARATLEDYANFSGHLFLANSYQALEDPNRFDLRFETARVSELLVANLLAPPGAGNLSQLLSQQEHLRFFDPRPFGASTLTEYRSTGDWRQLASFFGALGGLGYALDVAYESQHGQELNDWRERRDVSLQLKQRLGTKDEIYLQIGGTRAEAGDAARHYDPAAAKASLRVEEDQIPNLFLGWHRAWSPASHTLFLFSRLTDSIELRDPDPNVLFARQTGGATTGISTPPGFDSRFTSDFTLHSAELQHLWQRERHTLVAGGRFQIGDVESQAVLNRELTGLVNASGIDEPLRRGNVYGYYHWQLAEPLRFVGGVSYDRLTFPLNSELAPLTEGTATRDLISPKAGFVLTPWRDATLRGAYTRSLGGLFFDNSVRLEPTQIAGFNQAWRSLLPESSAGLVPGTEFDTANAAFDQRLAATGTYFGIGAEWLHSDGARTVGTLENSLPVPVPDSPASTRQLLDFRERNFSAYLVQLLGDGLSLGARYRWSEAQLEGRFPDFPPAVPGLEFLRQSERSALHQVALTLGYQHPSGFFSRWESSWYHQHNSGYDPVRPGDSFWQHDVWAGYRFPRRHAELRAGLLNLADTDYRLNPLNAYLPLQRGRTAVISLRLNF